MPLARTYDKTRGAIVTTIEDLYRDRLARPGDIQEYMPFLREQAACRENPVVAELGVRYGNSTVAFLAGLKGGGGHLWSADVNDVINGAAFRGPDGMGPWKTHPQWTFICGDDLHPAVKAALPEQVDVLFVDTSHAYRQTLEECRAYVPRVRPGGVALFHDTRVILNPWEHPWDGGEFPQVRKALDDYCAEAAREWEEIDGLMGLGVIRL